MLAFHNQHGIKSLHKIYYTVRSNPKLIIKRLWAELVRYGIALFFAFLFGYPLFWLFNSSLKPTREIIQQPWALPATPSIQAYSDVLSSTAFISYYRNSLLLAGSSVPMLTLIAALAAYAFARLPLPGRTVLFYLFLAGTMIPVHVTLIPLYAMMRDWGWLNSLIAIVFPYIGFGLPVSIYILRDFFEQLPYEIDEAARMDGCSGWQIFWYIALPMARPALATVFILNLVTVWNEYLFALTFVGANNEAYPLPLGVIAYVSGLGRVQYDRMMASLSLAALPILLVYALAQRQIIKSITAGAIKG